MHGVLLTVAYDGSAFSGWARQPGARTVEDVLEAALRSVDPEASRLRGVSRTDAGVHAEAQAVGVDVSRDIDARGWVLATNAALPEDVAVRAARRVPAGLDPRDHAKKKRYRYRLLVDRVRNPLVRHRAWRVEHALDLERMAREAARLEGTHDFAAFRTSRDGRQDTTRTISRVSVEPPCAREGCAERGVLSVVVEGDRFMHNMVRILVGTLVDVARGRLPEETVLRAFEEGQRSVLGPTAPAHGLTLERVELALPPGAEEPWPP
jgi:tRNA pseudouridine38-40 synthase